MNNIIFDEFYNLLSPQSLIDINNKIEYIQNKTDVYTNYDKLIDIFDNVINKQIINIKDKVLMQRKKAEFLKDYNNIQKHYKKIYFITELTDELKKDINEYNIVARSRRTKNPKINMVIATTENGTYISFPSLFYYTYIQSINNVKTITDLKDIKLVLFLIQYADIIIDKLNQYEKLITPYINDVESLFKKTYQENSKYFVLTNI